MSKISRIFTWLFLIIVLVALIVSTFGISIIFMALAIWAYNSDLWRELKSSDDFRDGNLFYRYGNKLNETAFSIPVDSNWSDEEVNIFVNTLKKDMKERIAANLGSAENFAHQFIEIRDRRETSDSKSFLKLNFETKRGSKLTHFVHYAVNGKTIVAHYFSYIRGTYRTEDVARFIVFSPISIWFWAFAWLQNRHSIVNQISSYSDNSFDLIDLSTFYESSYYVLLDQTRQILKEHNLLSDELAQVIFNNINNSQNVNVSGSNGVSLGNLTNTLQNTAKNIGISAST